MTNPVGTYSARELVRLHTSFDTAVAALVSELEITRDEAAAAMDAAHESIDWGPSARAFAVGS
jgi:hypothetical protein